MKLSIAISVRTFQVSFISFLLHKDYVCGILIWKKKSIRHNLSILGKLTDLDSFNRQKKCSNFLDTNRDVLFRLCYVCQKEKHCDNGMSSFEHFFSFECFFFHRTILSVLYYWSFYHFMMGVDLARNITEKKMAETTKTTDAERCKRYREKKTKKNIR